MVGSLPFRDVHTMFAAAEAAGRVGTARKTKAVDARPAHAGEVIVTHIADEGKETQSKPAETGDWVVRDRCPETGNETYLVKAETFAERYEGPLGAADPAGWSAYRPRGPEMRYLVVRPEDGAFTFIAPWGEKMVAKPGDVIARNPADAKDTYRIAAASFACTYEIVRAPGGVALAVSAAAPELAPTLLSAAARWLRSNSLMKKVFGYAKGKHKSTL